MPSELDALTEIEAQSTLALIKTLPNHPTYTAFLPCKSLLCLHHERLKSIQVTLQNYDKTLGTPLTFPRTASWVDFRHAMMQKGHQNFLAVNEDLEPFSHQPPATQQQQQQETSSKKKGNILSRLDAVLVAATYFMIDGVLYTLVHERALFWVHGLTDYLSYSVEMPKLDLVGKTVKDLLPHIIAHPYNEQWKMFTADLDYEIRTSRSEPPLNPDVPIEKLADVLALALNDRHLYITRKPVPFFDAATTVLPNEIIAKVLMDCEPGRLSEVCRQWSDVLHYDNEVIQVHHQTLFAQLADKVENCQILTDRSPFESLLFYRKRALLKPLRCKCGETEKHCRQYLNVINAYMGIRVTYTQDRNYFSLDSFSGSWEAFVIREIYSQCCGEAKNKAKWRIFVTFPSCGVKVLSFSSSFAIDDEKDPFSGGLPTAPLAYKLPSSVPDDDDDSSSMMREDRQLYSNGPHGATVHETWCPAYVRMCCDNPMNIQMKVLPTFFTGNSCLPQRCADDEAYEYAGMALVAAMPISVMRLLQHQWQGVSQTQRLSRSMSVRDHERFSIDEIRPRSDPPTLLYAGSNDLLAVLCEFYPHMPALSRQSWEQYIDNRVYTVSDASDFDPSQASPAVALHDQFIAALKSVCLPISRSRRGVVQSGIFEGLSSIYPIRAAVRLKGYGDGAIVTHGEKTYAYSTLLRDVSEEAIILPHNFSLTWCDLSETEYLVKLILPCKPTDGRRAAVTRYFAINKSAVLGRAFRMIPTLLFDDGRLQIDCNSLADNATAFLLVNGERCHLPLLRQQLNVPTEAGRVIHFEPEVERVEFSDQVKEMEKETKWVDNEKQKFFQLMASATELFTKEPACLLLSSSPDNPLIVLTDLGIDKLQMLKTILTIKPLSAGHRYLLMGDYLNWHGTSYPTDEERCYLMLLCWLKINFPSQVFSLAGNRDDLQAKHFCEGWEGKGTDGNVTIGQLVNSLPTCAFIDGKYLCSNGTIPPYSNLSEITKTNRKWNDSRCEGNKRMESQMKVLGVDMMITGYNVMGWQFDFRLLELSELSVLTLRGGDLYSVSLPRTCD